MEAPLEPEKVQRVLPLMGSPGLSDSAGGGYADRFLARFLLSLVQPFDSLSMEKKVLLLSELLRKLSAKCIGEVEEKYESFSKKLGPSLSGIYWKRCEESAKEGGKISGYACGIWNIPPLIRDEKLFCFEILNKHDASAVTIR